MQILIINSSEYTYPINSFPRLPEWPQYTIKEVFLSIYLRLSWFGHFQCQLSRIRLEYSENIAV